MNTDTNAPGHDWESEMTRELDRRVRDLHEAPLTLDHVRGRAHSIRRTRRLAVAGGLLAAAAVIVPIGVLAVPGVDEGRTPDRDLVATDPPTTTPTEGLSYLEGRTLRRPDGSSLRLLETYLGGADLGSQFLGLRPDGKRMLIDVVDDAGTITESIEISNGIVVNTDSTAVAYLEPDGDLMTISASGRTELASGLDPDTTTLAAFFGGPNCELGAGFCRVFYNYGDGRRAPGVTSSEATIDEAIPDALAINDANRAGLVTVQTESLPDASSCGGLYDERADAYVWETCDFLPLDLSPNSPYVSAVDAYQSGIGPTYVSVLDAVDGDELFRFEPEDGFVRDIAWEDDEHLLTTVYDPSGWSIYRIGADGTADQVAGPSREGDEVTPAYVVLGGR